MNDMNKMTSVWKTLRPIAVLAVGCIALANGTVHAQLDSPVSIDSIRATTDASIRSSRSHDQSTDVDSGSWSGHSRMMRRTTVSEAYNDVDFDADLIEGVLSASSYTRGIKSSSRSAALIEFSIDRPDQSRPDASWGWSLPSPLESLMGGAPPACRARLECQVQRSGVFGEVRGSMPSARRGGLIGLVLSRNGRVIADCLVGTKDLVSSDSIDIEIDLIPGDYVLQVECGFDVSIGFPRPSAVNGSVDFSLAFEEYGPGTAYSNLAAAEQEFDLKAGSGWAPWNWATIDSNDWRYRQVSDRDDIAAAGGVVGIGSGGCQGFQFTRTGRSRTSMHDAANAVNVTEMLFELPRRTDVGISSLFSFDEFSANRAVNHAYTTLVITRDATGEEVFRLEADVDDVDPWTNFGRVEQWINLDEDFYRMTLTTRSRSEALPEDAGSEVGFWFALVFQTP